MPSQSPRRETAGGYLLFTSETEQTCWHDSKAHRGVLSAITSGQGINCGGYQIGCTMISVGSNDNWMLRFRVHKDFYP